MLLVRRPLSGLAALACLIALAMACSSGAKGTASGPDVAPPETDTAPVQPDAEPFERELAPTGLGLYGYANGCFTVEAYDGDKTVRYLAGGQAGYAFSGEAREDGERFHFRASDLATYLLYDRERRYFTAETADTGVVTFARPDHLDSELDRLDEAFRSPAEWILQVSTRDPERYQLQHYATGRYLTLSGLTEDPAAAAVVALHPAEGCQTFPELALDATGTTQPQKWPDGDLWGMAEIHSHIFSDAGFGGGGLFHGAPFHRLGVERALPDCSRSHGPDGKRDIMGYFYDGNVGFDFAALLPIVTQGQVTNFNHATDGYPTFSQWPNPRKRATHQSMYYRWLERAYLGGLRLMVQHATGNSVMCELTVAVGAQKTLYSCNDMVSVDHAIDRAWQLERYIDAQSGGPGKGWLRIVTSPAQAREVIGQGKLALVLGIEISNLFDCFLTPPTGYPKCDEAMVKQKLDDYRKRGVRAIFPVHKYDNAFSPGDGSDGIIEVGNLVNCGHDSNFVQDCPDITTPFDGGGVSFGGLNKPREEYDSPAPHDLSGFGTDFVGTMAPFLEDLQAGKLQGDWCQKQGMTPLGKTLMLEMMKRGMLIDVAHFPRRALVDAYALLEAHDYPATVTHGDGTQSRIHALGGLTRGRIDRCGDPNKPGQLLASFKNILALAVSKGAYPGEALSFDLNGFAGNPGPRFGPNKVCGDDQINPVTYPFKSVDGFVTFQKPTLGTRPVDFNQEGMIHIGLLPELIEDALRDGSTAADLEPLFRSAEAYIRMWEKAEARAATVKP
jgi:hypothetical protein